MAEAGSAGSLSVSRIASSARFCQARVDRRVDAQAACPHQGGTVLRDELVADEAEEERLLDLREQLAGAKADLRHDSLAIFALADLPGVSHGGEHVVAAIDRLLRTVDRIEERRGLREPGEERRLRDRQLAGGLREVRLRSGLDSVRPVPVVHLVQVRLEDPLLLPCLVQLEREAGLLDLPLQGLLRADRAVEVSDELLGDRRAALHDVLRLEVREGGSRDRLVVDPRMLPEALVLDRHRRLDEQRRDLVVLERLTVVLCRDGLRVGSRSRRRRTSCVRSRPRRETRACSSA